MIKKSILSFIGIFFFLIANAQLQSKNLAFVDSLFQNRTEVVIKFEISSYHEIAILTNIVSIDNVKGNVVTAYANKQEFHDFLSLNYAYKIIQPDEGDGAKVINMATTVAQMASWDRYPTYGVYEQLMANFQTNYPTLCQIDTLVTLSSGRRILIAKISDNTNSHENEPQFLYSSTMHGDETTGYVLMLRLINYLLYNYGTNSRVTNIVNNIEIWICPDSNPDGTYDGGNSTVAGATRYNANSVDLNRNYPDPENGQHPDGNSWQPETQAWMSFADTMCFNIAANFHGGASVVNYPWDDKYPLAADDNWWQYVSNNYADTAQAFGSSGYFTDVTSSGITNGAAWYIITGGRQDYMNYWQYCREVTIELSVTKLLSSDELPNYWNYNYRSLLKYMEESLKGVRGIITDSISGLPVRAKVFISGHDFDSSHVYSELSVGNYHRYLNTGTYNITFSASGYSTKTINNVSVTNGNTTVLNIQLAPPPAPVADFSADLTTSCTGVIQFTDASTNIPTSWAWTFGDGGTSSSQDPLYTYTASGTYTVSLTSTNANGSDTETKTAYITISLPTAPATINDTICGSGTASLSASGSGTLNWYDASTGGTLLGTGTTYTTPTISTTTTYYVESTTAPAAQYVGNTESNTNGGFFTSATEYYLIFDAFAPFTIVSVEVNAGAAGNRLISLKNSAGTTIASTTINIPAGVSRINLNFDVPAGTDLRLCGPLSPNLYRNTAGITFPYEITGLVSIKSTNAAPTVRYYYFYDWEVQEAGCTSSRTPVTAVVNSGPAASVSIAANPAGAICTGTNVTFTATATNGGTSPAYQWKKNGTNISGTTNSTYTSSTLANGDIITCVMTSSLSCATGSPSTSNSITMTVNAGGAASVSIAASPTGSICAGTSVTFTATPTNGGTPT
ncbi:MAG: M14 family zinc carboxypeptidase, partial [Bacteroidota bacterium]